MSTKNYYARRAIRFGVLYVVALAGIKFFGFLAALSGTATIFDNPLRIASLAAIGIGWPTFFPHHFDWLRSLAFARRASGSVGGAVAIWAPFLIVAVAGGLFGAHATLAHDAAIAWAIAGMLALSDREHPGDRDRSKHDADDALRRVLASYEAIYGPIAGVAAPVAARSASGGASPCR